VDNSHEEHALGSRLLESNPQHQPAMQTTTEISSTYPEIFDAEVVTLESESTTEDAMDLIVTARGTENIKSEADMAERLSSREREYESRESRNMNKIQAELDDRPTITSPEDRTPNQDMVTPYFLPWAHEETSQDEELNADVVRNYHDSCIENNIYGIHQAVSADNLRDVAIEPVGTTISQSEYHHNNEQSTCLYVSEDEILPEDGLVLARNSPRNDCREMHASVEDVKDEDFVAGSHPNFFIFLEDFIQSINVSSNLQASSILESFTTRPTNKSERSENWTSREETIKDSRSGLMTKPSDIIPNLSHDLSESSDGESYWGDDDEDESRKLKMKGKQKQSGQYNMAPLSRSIDTGRSHGMKPIGDRVQITSASKEKKLPKTRRNHTTSTGEYFGELEM
jgi:hypothetical protein